MDNDGWTDDDNGRTDRFSLTNIVLDRNMAIDFSVTSKGLI